MMYEKYNPIELIEVGDLVSFVYEYDKITNTYKNTNKVTKSIYHRIHKNPVIGVCTSVSEDKVMVYNEGLINVNVTGTISIDDKLMASKIPGKAQAIKYPIYDEILFREVSIGKVTAIYRNYNVVQVLLDIDV